MKKKLYELLLERGLTATEDEARAIIMSGNVFAGGVKADKAGMLFDEACAIEVRQKEHPYVSRGGLKLARAIEVFGIDIKGKDCIDIGSSTGGFTDCMLQNGAASVAAVDVGVGELAWKLRNDNRVTVMEGVNARYLHLCDVDKLFDAGVTDVSFISLKHIFPTLSELTKPEGVVVTLIKPQFECERKEVGEGGIVTDVLVHKAVICKVREYAEKYGLYMIGIDFSPIKGMKGNTEFIAVYTKDKDRAKEYIPRVVAFIESFRA